MFKFKGISSEEMQVVVAEEEHFIARAAQRYETIENEKKKGQIRVIKVDLDNNEVRLQNVEFEVLNQKGEVVDRLKTDKNGEAVTKRLPIDEQYTIREIKTLEKYVLTEATKTVTLKENQIADIQFQNEKKK